MSFFSRFFGKNKSEQRPSLVKTKKLRMESLESRELLSVSPADYDAIRSHYQELDLAASLAEYNIIEVTELTAASMQAAFDGAAQTTRNDLIVVRLEAGNDKIDLEGSPLLIDIDSSLFGSVAIVGFDGADLSRLLNIDQSAGAALSIIQGDVTLAGMSFFGENAVFDSSNEVPSVISVGEQANLAMANVGFFWQGERLTYDENYVDGSTSTFALSETANLGFWTPYTWTDSIVLSSQDSFYLGDSLFGTNQNIYLNFAASNLGDQGIEDFYAQIWVDGVLVASLDSLSLDAWQLGGFTNISLGNFAEGLYTVEVVLGTSDSTQDSVRLTTSFGTTDEAQFLPPVQNISYEWDTDYAAYLLHWDKVDAATRYCVEVTDADGNVQREYILGNFAYMGTQNLLESGCEIKIIAQNALADSGVVTLEPLTGSDVRGSWPDATDPYNITDVIRTSGYVQVMYTSGYVDVTSRVYTAVPDQVYLELIRKACARWEEIITLGLPTDTRFAYLGSVDDLRIEFGFVNYGGGNILGSSYGGANRTAANGGLPATSTIIYNTGYFGANPDQATKDYFYDVVLHEIGHSLGYRTSDMQVTQTTTKPHAAMSTISGFDNYFYYTGNNGVREFKNIYGNSMPFTGSGDRFLLETVASGGSWGSHISEVYGTYYNGFGSKQTELMNWQAHRSGMTVSSITIGILEDLGYSVDYAMADPLGSYAPVNLTVTTVTGTSVSLSWNMLAGTAASYEIWRKDVSSGNDTWVKVGTSTTNSYTDQTTAANRKYEYQVAALNTSNVSAEVGIYSVASGGTLTWNSVAGASGYSVYQLRVDSSDNQLYWTRVATPTNTSYTASGVNYTTYYHVIANGVTQATSQRSRAVRVSTGTPMLGVPPSFTVTGVTKNSVSLSWTDIAGETAYVLQYSTNQTTWTNVNLPANTAAYTLSGRTAATQYYFRLKATAGSLESDWTSTLSAKTDDRYESNDSIAAVNAATAGATNSPNLGAVYGLTTLDNLVIVAGNDDYFRFELTETGTSEHYVKIDFNHSAGDLDFTLYNSSGTPIGTSILSSDVETISLNGRVAGVYYVQIYGYGGTANPQYKLTINAPGALLGTPVATVTSPMGNTAVVAWNNVTGAQYYSVWRMNSDSTWSRLATDLTTTTFTDTSAPVGRQYYRVYAHQGSNYTSSDAVYTMVLAPLTAPTLTLTSPAGNTVKMDWTAVSGATSYSAWRMNSDGTWTRIASNLTGTTFTDVNATPGRQYYMVYAHRVTEAVSSAAVYVTVLSPLAAPVLTVTSTEMYTAKLTWTAVSGATSYSVWRLNTTGTWTRIAANLTTTTFTETSAPGGLQYYKVYAIRGTESKDSAAVSVRVMQPLTSPVLTATSPVGNTARLDWTESDGATHYSVWRQNSSGTWVRIAASVTGTTFTETGLAAGRYYYMVYAIRGTETKASAVASTIVQNVLQAPVLTVSSSAGNTANLSWTAVSGATSYSAWRMNSDGTWVRIASNLTGTTFTDVTAPAGRQFYMVYAVRNAESKGSAAAYTVVLAPLAEPVLTVTSTASNTAKLEWTAVSGATSYSAWRYSSDGTWIRIASNLTGTTYTDSAAPVGRQFYRVYAIRGAEYKMSNAPYVVVLSPLGTPTLTVTSPVGNTAKLVWTAVSGATSYSVWRMNSDGTWARIAPSVTTTTFTDASAPLGRQYYVVYAIRGTETAASSAVYTIVQNALTKPVLTVTSPAVNTAKLTWTAVSGATNYSVWRMNSDGTWARIASNLTTTTFTDSSAPAGRQYYRVHAGRGDEVTMSDAVYTIIQAPPAAPVLSATALSDGNVQLNWTTTPGATAYSVWRAVQGGSYQRIASNLTGTSFTDGTAPIGECNYIVYATVGTQNYVSNTAVISTYEILRNKYQELFLSSNMADYNIIEISAANLSTASLNAAFQTAVNTSASDLIVVRTTSSRNTVYLDQTLNIYNQFNDYNTVNIVSLGAEKLTLNASQISSNVIDVSSGAGFGGITFTGGSYSSIGGGLWFSNASVLMTQCVVTGNYTYASNYYTSENTVRGGGIYASNSSVVISNSAISGNYAYGATPPSDNYYIGGAAYGGAIYATNCDFYIQDSTITNNAAYGGSVSGSAFAQGGAAYGGAIYSENSYMNILDSTIAENSAEGGAAADQATGYVGSEADIYGGRAYGGAIYSTNSASLDVNRTTIAGNIAVGGHVTMYDSYSGEYIYAFGGDGIGGGVCVEDGYVDLHNSVLAGNSATAGGVTAVTSSQGAYLGNGSSLGGGLYNYGTALVVNCTIVGNNAVTGGGIMNEYYAPMNLLNSIVSNNLGGDVYSYSSALQLGNSYVGDTSSMSGYTSLGSNLLGYVNAGFTSFSTYGTWNKNLWRNWNLRLATSSVCVNAGNDGYVSWWIDLDRNYRFCGSAVDLGAYENTFVSW